MSHNTLQKFCTQLTTDPALWAAFRANPEKVVADAGLSDEEQKLFTTGPYGKLMTYLGRSESAFSAMVVNPVKKSSY
mgnify:CR=1 FL=1